jgi:hypothetical protein
MSSVFNIEIEFLRPHRSLRSRNISRDLETSVKMWSIICLSLCLGAAFAQTQYTSTGAADVAKAKATALTESPTSNIAGKTLIVL